MKPALLDILLSLKWTTRLARQVGAQPDYVIDPNIGNDNNAGTLAAPWATLTKLRTTLNALPLNASKVAFIRAATYTDQHLELDVANSGWTHTIAFQAGASMVWTSLVTNGNAIHAGNTNGTLTCYLNGLSISGYQPGSGNGLGCANATLIAYGADAAGNKAIVDNCDDGMSAHFAGNMDVYDVIARNCTKSAFAHVGTGTVRHYRCDFTARSAATLGIGSIVDATVTGVFQDCTFTPISAGQLVNIQNSTLLRCKLGTPSLRVTIDDSTNSALTDCYVNAGGEGYFPTTWTQCYGRLSLRLRGATSVTDSIFRKCVFVGNATGLDDNTTGLLYANYDPGDGSADGIGYDFRDCIVTGYFSGVGNGFTANQLTKFNATSKLDNICTYGSTTGIVSGITIEANELTSNPLIGAHNTTVKSDYGYAVGSPCIGAGYGGGNIGFAA